MFYPLTCKTEQLIQSQNKKQIKKQPKKSGAPNNKSNTHHLNKNTTPKRIKYKPNQDLTKQPTEPTILHQPLDFPDF